MHWEHLRTLLVLCREGRVAYAARALGVSRSTVHRRIEALEHGADVALVMRTPDGVVPTEAGARLLPLAERMEMDALAAERHLAGHDIELRGRLDVTVFEGAERLLGPVFTQMSERWPQIDLHVCTSDRLVSLHRRESDLAIRATLEPNKSLYGRRAGLLQYAVYGTPELAAADNPPWILWTEDRGAVGTEAWARSLAHPLRVAARVDTFHMMWALCCAGAGLGVLPVPLAWAEPSLVAVGDVPVPSLAMPLWVLVHPEKRRATRVRTALRFVLDRLPSTLARGAPFRLGDG